MNRYFLLIACLQLIPEITSVSAITTWVPLLVIFSISAAKEGYDDSRRAKEDSIFNAKINYILQRDHVARASKRVPVKSQDIRVGQILYIEEGTEVPCDIMLLKTSNLVHIFDFVFVSS